MSTYDVVLYVHIAVLLSAFALGGVLHGSEWLMVRSATVGELRVTARPQRLGPLFAPVILALMGSGFWLLHLSRGADGFRFRDPFVWTAAIVLAVLFLDGPLVLGRHETVLRRQLAGAPDGPVTAELRATATNRTAWTVSYANTFTVLGVVLNMTTKPRLLWCVVDILAGAALGALVARAALSRAEKALAASA